MKTAIIIDDEEKCCNDLREELSKFPEHLQLVGIAKDLSKGVELIQKEHPDLVFLDINLSQEDGFSLFEKFEKIDFKVVFVTAYEDRALDAFKPKSMLHFIVKPVKKENIEMVLAKLETHSTQVDAHDIIEQISAIFGQQKISIKLRDSNSVIISVNDIIYCQAEKNYTKIVVSGRDYPLQVSALLKDVFELLEKYTYFKRPHRSYCININQMQHYNTFEYTIVMKNKANIPISENTFGKTFIKDLKNNKF